MIHTFDGICEQVLRVLDESGNTSTTRELVEDYVNQAHQQRLSEFPWPFLLWDSAETFTTTNTTQLYPLHQEFTRPLYFFNRTKRDYLIEVPVRTLQDGGHRWNTDTNAQHFVLWGRTPVKYQPTSASVITIVSSHTGDTGSTYDIVIKGVTSDGVVKAEIVTPLGTSTASSITEFTKILAVTKATEWNGTLTITSNSGAVTNLTLNPTEMGRSYQQLYFLGAPSTGDVIEYRFYRQPLTLVNDYDIPELPPPHSQILVWDALIMFGGYNSDVTPQALATWRAQQERMEKNLHQAFNEAQSIGAQPRFVRNLSEDSPVPRIYRQ